MAKKKFSKEFKLGSDWWGDIQVYNLNGKYLTEFCKKIFRRAFKMPKKSVPLDKPTKVRVDITIL